MATVYLARDLKHDRHVAIKVLHTELANALGPERFLREIDITAKLDHPHILPLLDSGQANGLLYYVMPYVDGESLRDYLNRERPLPVEEALDVGTALGYAVAGRSIVGSAPVTPALSIVACGARELGRREPLEPRDTEMIVQR